VRDKIVLRKAGLSLGSGNRSFEYGFRSRRLLGHHAAALDCYQETFLAAWRFGERHSVADWASFLTSLAIRRAMDRLRQRYRERSRLVAIGSAHEPGSALESLLSKPA
jgi:DNA-directed RNA polymerase specialized sigma24 family protein